MGARIMSVSGKRFEGSTRKALARDRDGIAAVAERSQDRTAGAGDQPRER